MSARERAPRKIGPRRERLRELRKARGLTLSEMGEQIGMSLHCYMLCEHGAEVRVDTAIRIADTLGIRDLREIFGDGQREAETGADKQGPDAGADGGQSRCDAADVHKL